MSTTTAPRDIAAEIAARLSQISVVNGYLTGIGAKVFRGKRAIDLGSECPCVVLIEAADSPQDQTRSSFLNAQRYILEAHLPCDPDNPNDAAHDAIEDMKHALWHDASMMNGVLGGKVKALHYKGRAIGPREDGEAVVMAGIQFDAEFVEALRRD